MRRVTNQFMWGFQHHFRKDLERTTAQLFRSIGFGVGPRVFLVGFTDDESRPFPICFEPENDPLAGVDLTIVNRRAAERYKSDPATELFITSSRHHTRYHADLRDKARAAALRETFEAHASGADRYFFVGRSARVERVFDVYPVISVPRARWDSKPSLQTLVKDRYAIVPSLQHALIKQILDAASRTLSQQESPEVLGIRYGGDEGAEIVRKAAYAFTQSISVLAGYDFASGVHAAMDAVAAQPYEGRAGAGKLVLATSPHPAVQQSVTFIDAIPLSQPRSVRKALEMTTADLALLCDGETLRGLGFVDTAYTPSEESAFEFEVIGRGSWELRHSGVGLMRVDNGRPSLPEPRLSRETFKDTTARIFPECGPEDLDRLWALADAASHAEHGTMLVVHRQAAEEARRLLPQSQRIEPIHLAPGTLGAVTGIDGAVLVDPSGRCHAVGVILDGEATGTGDAGRGARYNSAIRYHKAVGADCMVVIVSEDGMIDILPRLRRRVTRAAVEAALEATEDALTDDPDYEVFFRLWDHLETLSFYLNQGQCDRANAARDKLELHRQENAFMVLGWRRLQPDLAMDDSYFIDDPAPLTSRL